MSANAIETRNLAYKYSALGQVLHDVNLTVPQRSIYGFLGPNGAGKTTTMRLLLGLLRRQQGSIEIFGASIEKERVPLLKRIGSSIESPSLYSHLSARENLAIWQSVFRCPEKRIGEVLELVGLAHTGKKRAGEFSQGMKQRLSIAIALLHEPELLILDEPTNGLDPHGIIDMRELLLTLNRERGITIIVSSHLLSEVERLITHAGILNKGALVFQGPLSELVEKQQAEAHTLLDTSDNPQAIQALAAGGWSAYLDAQGKVRLPLLSPSDRGALSRQLVLQGIGIYELASGKKDLEQIFLSLVQDGAKS